MYDLPASPLRDRETGSVLELDDEPLVLATAVLRRVAFFARDRDGVSVPIVMPENSNDPPAMIELLEGEPPADLAEPLSTVERVELEDIAAHIWNQDQSQAGPAVLVHRDDDALPSDSDRLARDELLLTLFAIAEGISAKPA